MNTLHLMDYAFELRLALILLMVVVPTMVAFLLNFLTTREYFSKTSIFIIQRNGIRVSAIKI